MPRAPDGQQPLEVYDPYDPKNCWSGYSEVVFTVSPEGVVSYVGDATRATGEEARERISREWRKKAGIISALQRTAETMAIGVEDED